MAEYRAQYRANGSLDEMPRVLQFVREACEQAGVSPDAWFDLELVAEEACANVIEHAYGGQGGEYTLELMARGEDVVIRVSDCGRPFEPDSVAPPELSRSLLDRKIGGLGLHLMYQLMDEVRFSFSESGNLLTMVKHGVVTPTESARPSSHP